MPRSWLLAAATETPFGGWSSIEFVVQNINALLTHVHHNNRIIIIIIIMSVKNIAIVAFLVSSAVIVTLSKLCSGDGYDQNQIFYAIADDDNNIRIRHTEDGRFVGKASYTRSINVTGWVWKRVIFSRHDDIIYMYLPCGTDRSVVTNTFKQYLYT